MFSTKHQFQFISQKLLSLYLSLNESFRYDNYPTHCSNDFLDPATNHCRIAKVEPDNRKGLGAASLNLTNIQERDRGWYNCKVIHLNRHPEKESQDNVSVQGLCIECSCHKTLIKFQYFHQMQNIIFTKVSVTKVQNTT